MRPSYLYEGSLHAETESLYWYGPLVTTMAIGALVPYVAKSTTAMALAKQDERPDISPQ